MDYRHEFAAFEGVTYLNAAGQGPLPLVAARAAQAAIEWKKRPQRIPEGAYFDLPDRVRALLARLIHAQAEEVAITTGASSGLAAVAAGIEWKEGEEVLVARGEFPAHFTAWMPIEQRGVRIHVVAPRERFLTAEDFIARLGPRTRLVSASLVRFDDGARLDAPRLAAACHATEAALLIDVSQCVGAMPVNVQELGADFVVAAGYKWLLSPYGTGFFWIKPGWAERLHSGPLYWMALEGARDFHSLPFGDLKVTRGARRWDSPETASFFNLAAMEASVELLLRVGVENIAAHNEHLLAGLEERLPHDRCVLASPRESARRGPFLCVAGRTLEKTCSLYAKLTEAQIIVGLRESALRIAPHLYNTEQDIARLAYVLAA